MSERGPFDGVPRKWWFPAIPTYRPDDEPHRTYHRYDLDLQPAVSNLIDGSWRWLSAQPEPAEWSITHDDEGRATRILRFDDLERVVDPRSVDPGFRALVERPELQGRLRSCTGCFLELSDFAVEVEGEAGVLCHFLSDQQWVKHWLVWCGQGPDLGKVVAADLPYGIDTDGWFDEPVPSRLGELAGTDLTICADSFEEFMYRIWAENELWYAAHDDGAIVPPEVAAYAQRLPGSDRGR